MHSINSRILILPNAWDVPSARMFEKCGFKAIATSSAGMLVSLGFADGEEIGRDASLKAFERIGGLLSVPLSVDIVSGFGSSQPMLEKTVEGIVGAGAVGLNVEDLDVRTDRLIQAEKQVDKLKTIRRTCEKLGVPVVINARTDAIRHADGNEEERLSEAIRRAIAYRDAGADCVYPMGLFRRI